MERTGRNIMTTPHKWAAEIHAMADGEEVEGNFSDFGSDIWTPATNDYNPLTNPSHQWRIVPEKIVLRYRVALMKDGDHYYTTTAEREGASDDEIIEVAWKENAEFVEWRGDWQEVEVER
jgi:hypothetical protein